MQTRYLVSVVIVGFGALFVGDLWAVPFSSTGRLLLFGSALATFSALSLIVFRVRKLLPKLAALAVSTLFAIGVAEVVFRVVMVEPQVPRNNRAFEDAIAATWPYQVAVERSPETFRIVSLADSFGRSGEEKNFTYVLHEGLQSGPRPVEVVNIAEWGWELSDELTALRRFGLRYQPDLVLHSFFVGNDFDLPTEELTAFGGILMRNTSGWRSLRPRNFALRTWLTKRRQALGEARLKAEEFGPGEVEALFSTRSFLAVERRRVEKWTEAELSGRWRSVQELLDSIRMESETAGARYGIIIHPDQYQVEVTLRQRIDERYPGALSEVDVRLPQRLMGEYCAERQIPCLDLLPQFEAEGVNGGLYLVHDTHYSEKGNRLAAKLILEFAFEEFQDVWRDGATLRTKRP